jgi:hypothetical protein
VPGKAIFLQIRAPPDAQGRKGGDKTMSILEFTALLSLLGGAIYVTFQITWTVSHSDDKDKKNDRL